MNIDFYTINGWMLNLFPQDEYTRTDIGVYAVAFAFSSNNSYATRDYMFDWLRYMSRTTVTKALKKMTSCGAILCYINDSNSNIYIVNPEFIRPLFGKCISEKAYTAIEKVYSIISSSENYRLCSEYTRTDIKEEVL